MCRWTDPRLPLRAGFGYLVLRPFLFSFPPPPHFRYDFRLLFPPFEKNCTPFRAPEVDRGRFDHLDYDQLHALCNSRGYSREDSKLVLRTRASLRGAGNRKCAPTEHDPMDFSVRVREKRGRAPAEVVGNLDAFSRNQEKRCRVEVLRAAFVSAKEVVKGHARRRHPELESRLDATRTSVLAGVDVAISAWVAEECNRVLGQEVTEEEAKFHSGMAREATEQESRAWKQFKAFKPLRVSEISDSVASNRRAPTWKMVGSR